MEEIVGAAGADDSGAMPAGAVVGTGVRAAGDPLRARRAEVKFRDDPAAVRVAAMLASVAAMVDTDKEPAVKPPCAGMVRLGMMDRASYVFFLPCHPDYRASDGRQPVLCNHGFGVDRQYGHLTVRAWNHGAPEVHTVEIHATEVTVDVILTAVRLVGIPLRPAGPYPPGPCRACALVNLPGCYAGVCPLPDNEDKVDS